MPLSQWFKTYFGKTPSDVTGGARCLNVTATLAAGTDPVTGSAGARADLDLTADALNASLLFVQAVYLDLADVPPKTPITLQHADTGYRVKAYGGSQGWYVFNAGDTMKFQVIAPASMIGASVRLALSNAPVTPDVWAASQAAPAYGTAGNASADVLSVQGVAGGTPLAVKEQSPIDVVQSQAAITGNPQYILGPVSTRKFLMLTNNGVNKMYVAFGYQPNASTGFTLNPGQTIMFDKQCPTANVGIFGTAGDIVTYITA